VPWADGNQVVCMFAIELLQYMYINFSNILDFQCIQLGIMKPVLSKFLKRWQMLRHERFRRILRLSVFCAACSHSHTFDVFSRLD
jgi:hypothetical protein